MIESDFDLKENFLVYFNWGVRQIGQSSVVYEIENSFLKEIKDCAKLVTFEFLDCNDRIEHFYKDKIENILKFEADYCSTIFIKTNDKTDYRKLMFEIFDLSFDEFSEEQTNLLRVLWD